EESVTNTPSRSPAKVVSVAVHHGAGSACRVAVSRRSHRCDRTQTAVMTRAMPKAVVIRGGEALPLMPKIWSAKSVRIVAGMLPVGNRLDLGDRVHSYAGVIRPANFPPSPCRSSDAGLGTLPVRSLS